MADKLDIEETNRIRVSLGMQPLPVPGGASNSNGPAFKPTADSSDSEAEDPASTLETRQAAASDNWQKLQDEAKSKQDREASRLKIRKAREAAQRFAKLEGKWLGEAEDKEMDTKSWLLSSKKREKKIAKQRAKALEQELRDRENQAQYTEADLAGVQVGHEAGAFEEDAGEQILTLKDAGVEDEDAQDELENADLREKERLEDRLKLKRKRPDYDPMDEDAEKNGVLDKYDEEIQGKAKKHFTLGQMSTGTSKKQDDEGLGAGRMRFSLDYAAPTQAASDYVDPSTIKIKKPKKKKDKTKKRRRDDLDEEDIFPEGNDAAGATNANSMEVDEPATKRDEAERFDEEDDDLEARLAASRKQALKKRKDRAAELARQIREEDVAAAGEDLPQEEDGLILDETTEFVAGLQRPKASDESKPSFGALQACDESKPSFRRKSSTGKPEDADSSADEDADGDVPMAQGSPIPKAESDASRPVSRDAPHPSGTGTGLEAEEGVDQSIGATLNLLRRRNLIRDNHDGSDLNASLVHQQRFLADLHKREADADRKARLNRERDRASGRLSHMSRKEQEDYAQKENKQRDYAESRQLADVFNEEYKPNVNLKYIDEHGRHMGQKEAFRELSHMFHGKMPGKQKVEKKLKKIENERKREAASLVDGGGSKGGEGKSATERKGKGAGVRLQ
ncbi:MAG: hypothetical protein M1828_000686 [Chrysothrix sp. TS-e1954]|nr:MAG: hypothetical protein M1828_000686 [Chrysothrix sp. TS-e1954]